MFCEEELDGTCGMNVPRIPNDSAARDSESLLEAITSLGNMLQNPEIEYASVQPKDANPLPAVVPETVSFAHDQTQLREVASWNVNGVWVTPRACVHPCGLCRGSAAAQQFAGRTVKMQEFHSPEEWHALNHHGKLPDRTPGKCLLCRRAYTEGFLRRQASSLRCSSANMPPVSEYDSVFGQDNEYAEDVRVVFGSLSSSQVRWDGTLHRMRLGREVIGGRKIIVFDQSALMHGASEAPSGFGKRA